MREFLHGWRRKAGCVALVMSVAMMGMWIRSPAISDRIVIRRYGHITEYWVSQQSGIGWSKEVGWNLIGTDVLTDVPYREWYGFKYGMKLLEGPVAKVNVRIIPYRSITIPLTLLSACLILRKSRKRPSLLD